MVSPAEPAGSGDGGLLGFFFCFRERGIERILISVEWWDNERMREKERREKRREEREIGIVTCVCSRVRPRIHRICPARGFLSESGSNFSSPRLIAPISSGWPRPHLFLKKTWKTISSSLGFSFNWMKKNGVVYYLLVSLFVLSLFFRLYAFFRSRPSLLRRAAPVFRFSPRSFRRISNLLQSAKWYAMTSRVNKKVIGDS